MMTVFNQSLLREMAHLRKQCNIFLLFPEFSLLEMLQFSVLAILNRCAYNPSPFHSYTVHHALLTRKLPY